MRLKKKIFTTAFVSLLLLASYQLIGKRAVAYAIGSLFRPDVMIHSLPMTDGIGKKSMELAQALSQTHRVQIKAKHVNKKNLPQSVLDISRVKYKQRAPVAIIEDCVGFSGNTLDRFFSRINPKNQVRYIYSMLESTQIKPEWATLLNTYLDAVIVSDPLLVNVYKNLGVAIPIFHIPTSDAYALGQYRCLISPKKIILSDVNLIADDFIYTTSGSLCQKYLHLDQMSSQPKNLQVDFRLPMDRVFSKNKNEMESFIGTFPLEQYGIFSTTNNEFFYCDEIDDTIKNFLRKGISWESHIGELMKKYTKPDTLVLDIGAHIGTHTLTLARAVGANGGKVIAFEPQPKIFRELFMNMHLNDTHNVDFMHSAVGGHDGEIELSPLSATNEGGTGISGGAGVFVSLRTIDSLKLENISLMKIDVEGFEDEVLAGARETILRNKPVIFIEIMGGCDIDTTESHYREKILATKNTLEQMGYTIQRIGVADYLALPVDSV